MVLGLTCLTALLLFSLLLLSLAFQPKLLTRITGALLAAAALGGILIYGYGYSSIYGNVGQAAVRTLFSVFCMFLGRNEISAVSSVGILASPAAMAATYAVHLLALYCTTSAVAAAIGARLLRTLRLLLLHRGNLNLIYGVSDELVSFGEKLQRREKGMTVFVDSGGGASFDSRILQMGSLLLGDDAAKKADASFLKKLGLRPGKRRLSLYCLSASPDDNLRYAEALRKTMEEAGILPEQTELTILLEDEDLGGGLQKGDAYGYGSVFSFDLPSLVARLMVRTVKPHEALRFDRWGCAEEDLGVLVVGFGRMGQAALRSLWMNGQFQGSRFHAFVAAKDCASQAGSFFSRCPGLRGQEAISFLETDARSEELLRFLTEKGSSIRCAAVCSGSDKLNAEIAEMLSRLFRSQGRRVALALCSERGVSVRDGDGDRFTSLFSPELLCGRTLDAGAMLLNHQYHAAEGRSPEEDWARADYFSRMSCRASADFLDAFLFASGKTAEDLAREGWKGEEKLVETLSRTEHLRWCAFHLAMGYRVMPPEVWAERAKRYRRELEEKGASAFRVGKDTEKRLHACLIPWEELDRLSRKESELTGRHIDYQQMDRDNILLLPEIVKGRVG